MIFPSRVHAIATLQERVCEHFPVFARQDPELLSLATIWLGNTMSVAATQGYPTAPSDAAAWVHYTLQRNNVAGRPIDVLLQREADPDGKPVGLPLIERLSTVVFAELMRDQEFVKSMSAGPKPMIRHALASWGDDALSMVWRAGRSVPEMVVDAKTSLARNVKILVHAVEAAGSRVTQAMERGLTVVVDGTVSTWDRLHRAVMKPVYQIEHSILKSREAMLNLVTGSLDVIRDRVSGNRDGVRERLEALDRRMAPYFAEAIRENNIDIDHERISRVWGSDMAPVAGPWGARPQEPVAAPHGVEPTPQDLGDDELEEDDYFVDDDVPGLESEAFDEPPVSSPRGGFASMGMSC